MSRIIVLNGAARANGSTAKLVESFVKGAEEAGCSVEVFDLYGMDIRGCRGCLRAGGDGGSPCSIKDDMDRIYKAFDGCDAVVFASPVYFWTVTGTLKTACDRLYAVLETKGYRAFARDCALLMTADGGDYSQALDWYMRYERNLGWRNRGVVLGKGKVREAYELGRGM